MSGEKAVITFNADNLHKTIEILHTDEMEETIADDKLEVHINNGTSVVISKHPVVSNNHWRQYAPCKDNPDLFFAAPDEPAKIINAREMCHSCSCIASCLEYALDDPNRQGVETFGIWAGFNAEALIKIARARRIANSHLRIV